jgi:glycosyltransferase involved in cell wall biosynthesis
MNFKKVLTVEEQRFRPNEWGMPGFEERHIKSPLINSKVTNSVESFYFSEYGNIDLELYNYCLQNKPDLLLLTVQFKKVSKSLPSEIIINKIAKELNIPIVMFWFDLHSLEIFWLFEKYSIYATLNVILGSSYISHNPINLDCNYVYAGLTFNEELFDIQDIQQDIDIGFYGTLHPERDIYVKVLEREGYKVLTAGGILLNGARSNVDSKGNPLWIPYNDYINLMRRTKIILNFSHLYGECHQVRGRVFETLWCNSFLLEEDNPVTSEYFTPYEDYIPFTDIEDLICKVNAYLFSGADRDRIRYHGRSTIEKHYNSKRFWGELLKEVISIKTENKICRGKIWNVNYYGE